MAAVALGPTPSLDDDAARPGRQSLPLHRLLGDLPIVESLEGAAQGARNVPTRRDAIADARTAISHRSCSSRARSRDALRDAARRGPARADGRLHRPLRRAQFRHARARRGSSNSGALDELRGDRRCAATCSSIGALATYTDAHPIAARRRARCRCSSRPRARSAACRSRIAARSAATSRTPRRRATRCRCSRRPTRRRAAERGRHAARAVHGVLHRLPRRRCCAPDELIVGDRDSARCDGRQWFRKVGTRAAQAISKVVMAGVSRAATAAAHRVRQRRADGRAAAATPRRRSPRARHRRRAADSLATRSRRSTTSARRPSIAGASPANLLATILA